MKSCIDNIQVDDILLMWTDRRHAFVTHDSEDKIQIEEFPVLEKDRSIFWVTSHANGRMAMVLGSDGVIVGVKKKQQ